MLIATWLNGKIINSLDRQERAFAYGDGLFSTLSVEQAQVKLLHLHWQRIETGCQRLAIACDDLAQWQADFLAFIAAYPHCIAKIIISRGSGGRGYLPDLKAKVHCYFYAYSAVAPVAAHQQGIDSGFLSQRLGINPLLAGIKHLNRLEQVLLRQELAQLTFAEGVVCDCEGRVIEGVFSNIFIFKDGVLYTPDLQKAGVDGVMRQHILQLASKLAWSIHITTLWPEQILSADEVFFCNSVYGIWPVKQIQGTIWTKFPLTQYLQASLYQDCRKTSSLQA